ncbi:hypothetical protein ABID14_000242 [Peptoniphilus olsenii]|uniref:Uncharacterized protein n=1 Tax=Peptoniphilus olsenii TaxID=411570 RepID=A0ABV2J767_9FIRM
MGENIKDALIEITADGVITEDEKGKLEDIMKQLQKITKVAGELKIWVKKNLEV